MHSIVQVLKQNQVIDQILVTQTCILQFEKKLNDKFNQKSVSHFEIQCSKSVPAQKFKVIEQRLKKLNPQIQIIQQLGKGQKMPAFSNFHQVFFEDKSDLIHKPGQVLLVDVWATWCGPCQNPMNHNQEMLVKNEEKWKGKARIVAVSVDEKKQTIIKRVNEKGWNKIEHLTLLGWDGKHPLIQNFQISGIPFVFLVDKEGTIDFSGHPSEINLQKRINELIQMPEKSQKPIEGTTEDLEKAVFDQIKKKECFKNAFSSEIIQQKIKNADLFSARIKITTNIAKGKVQSSKPQVHVAAFEDSADLIQQFKNTLKDFDPSTYEFIEKLVKFTFAPDIQSPECAECKTKLQYPFYWCRWQPNPNILRCRNCIQKNANEDKKLYSYKQNSVLLGGPWKKIALLGLGNNIQPNSIEQVHRPHQFGCNGCGACPSKIGEARYICLACRNDPNPRGDYIDICNQCFGEFWKGNEDLRKRLKEDGHLGNHPLLRVLYNVRGYYEF